MAGWTEARIPDLAGRTALVTGANSGLGLQIATVLAEQRAEVVLAGRSAEKLARAQEQITARYADARLSSVLIDLASLESVQAAAAQVAAEHETLDLLINNAGVMAPPETRTVDGFELTFATNHLGPFALTAQLMPRLLATPGSRVVTVSSIAHTRGVIHFEDLQLEAGYDTAAAYRQSKLANLLFSAELDRRLRAAGASTLALAAHPGVVPTDLFKTSSRFEQTLLSRKLWPLNALLAHDVVGGARPMLRAATDPAAQGGEYYGPARLGMTGPPVVVRPAANAQDDQAASRLWQVSEELTGVPLVL